MNEKIKEREYKVVVKFKIKAETAEKGLGLVKEAFKTMGLDVVSVKNVSGLRSENQNNALHLWLDQIATEAERRGLTVDMWLKHPTEMKITESMLKDSFRATGEVMFKRKSTADLEKFEFSEVQRLFDKAVLERLGIDIPFPNLELLIDRDNNLTNNKNEQI
jgi:hypothetical protein